MYCHFRSVDNLHHVCTVCGKPLTTRFTQSQAKMARARLCGGKHAVQPVSKGPGDYLHDLILRWTGEGMTLGCDCKAWITKMNDWGPSGCREHLDEIVAHMLKEAKKRGWKLTGMPGAKTVAGLAIKRACRMAEKAEVARAN